MMRIPKVMSIVLTTPAITISVFIFCLLLALIFTYPAINVFTTHIIGDGGDGLDNFTNMIMFRDTVRSGQFPFSHTAIYRFPDGYNSLVQENKFFTLIGGTLSLLMNPVLAFNALVILIMLANSFTSYLFYRQLSDSYLAAIAGAIINGFSFHVLMRAYGTISYMTVFWYPLAGLLLLNMFKKGIKPFHNYLFAIIVYGFVLCGMTPTVIAVVTALSLIFVGLLVSRKKLHFLISETYTHTQHLLLSLLLLTILTYSTQHQYFAAFSAQSNDRITLFGLPKIPFNVYIIPPLNYYQTQIAHVIKDNGISLPSVMWWHEGLYMGLSLIFILFHLFDPRRRDTILKFWLSAMIAQVLLLVLPSFLLPITVANKSPFHFILRFITDYNYSFITPFWFFAAGFITLKLKKYSKRIIIIIILLAIIERLNIGYPTSPVSAYDGHTYAHIVRTLPGNAVLDIPVDVYTEYNLLPYAYNKPIVGGFIHYYAETAGTRKILDTPEIARFACTGNAWLSTVPYRIPIQSNSIVENLNRRLSNLSVLYGIETVVIHKHKFSSLECEYAQQHALSIFPDIDPEVITVEKTLAETLQTQAKELNYYQKVYSDNGVIVYQARK